MLNIIKTNSEQQFNETGAGIIASLLQSKPRAILGLATGSTPVGVYEKLIELYKQGSVSFKQASSYNLDEYIGLPADHPESYRRFMDEKLFNHIDILPENTHVPEGNAPDPEQAAKDYAKLLDQAGQIDLQLLGLGHNGHIGFNEPADELTGPPHVVKLQERTRLANARFFNSIDEVPTHALTMGIGSILQAKQILLMAKGEDKAEIIAKALKGPITTQCPASLLQTHPNVVVVVDQAAGRFL
ncbi:MULTISPECIES: glucosamine-6-phosphate deaminase [Paenibacillus]|mgnify:FL=1|jgi:glucosamine-6-phosphate deaminase|uniref:Glucosamine-6-phosphate deaminase n=2 Tax=Paenibacillus barengoltzii TaxID=343517 RepID=R9LS41_9BACL|nr:MULTISPECIES: glucosamine-6-phosphate deaminase [Paenibacillus]EOS58547.1 glucosamine-6-phosphate deaminase [Paenibacillus barengoltzii G22]MDU0332278.1 glucosamine-6-phosphate deaminase [Paenibacillus sp. 3LSP]MEC2343348.1 glucosamine-6-phosphate deaminase [Paenibacillus barengoltzii]SMF56920.1 glucosamine-6-phosphate deaminase [Paenibacillus barengoltzii J12]SMF58534.1 glucosamine-6-phosphate deaminase [Paenibacillus barengoltzii]